MNPPPSVADILRADHRVWLLLAQATLDGIQPRGGSKPLETALDDILKQYEVAQMLVCRPRCTNRATPGETAAPKAAARKANAAPSNSASDKAARREDNMEKQIDNLKKKLENEKPDASDGGNGGRGRGKKKGGKGGKGGRGKGKDAGKGAKRKFIAMPQPLIGLDPTDENGEPYCFGAALGKRTPAKWGAKCPKGWHKCMAKGCNKLHAYVGNH